MKTEINRYIRKRLFVLFLMFLCLQGASCGQEKIVIQAMEDEATDSLDDTDDLIENQLEEIADKTAEENDEPLKFYIYVCGAVRFPGVYQMDSQARIYEAIDKAGGLNEDADKSAINLALQVEDGQMIYVPTVEEVQNGTFSSVASTEQDVEDGLVNINTAGIDELTTLSGVGKVKASSIIEYRQNNGAFMSIEDIMNVSGIGQGSFDKIKNQIKVK